MEHKTDHCEDWDIKGGTMLALKHQGRKMLALEKTKEKQCLNRNIKEEYC